VKVATCLVDVLMRALSWGLIGSWAVARIATTIKTGIDRVIKETRIGGILLLLILVKKEKPAR
jgi:hypothetical protein